jgi:hypothetical protein
MVVCHEKKCIFIHIPKTAGTSIEQFLREKNKNELEFIGLKNNRSMQHYRAVELKIQLGYIFNLYYKFSIIRNPYDRLLSEYYWTPIPNVGYKYGKTKFEFLNYVTDVIKNNKIFENKYNDHFIPQYLFLYHGKKLLVDQIFKYEDLEWVENYLKKKLNIDNNLPFLNKSKLNIEKEDWNPRQKERIYKLYKADFLIFNYEK